MSVSRVGRWKMATTGAVLALISSLLFTAPAQAQEFDFDPPEMDFDSPEIEVEMDAPEPEAEHDRSPARRPCRPTVLLV